MKVIIDFDQTSLVVPCGEGKSTIRDLKSLAALRYKKFLNKPDTFSVSIAGFKLAGTHAILDPDDLICEVCDNDQHLTACFYAKDIGGQPQSGPDCDRMSSISKDDSEDGFWATSRSSSINSIAGAVGGTEETRAGSCLNKIEKTKPAGVKV